MDRNATNIGWRGLPEMRLKTACAALFVPGISAMRIQTFMRILWFLRIRLSLALKGGDELLVTALERCRTRSADSLVNHLQICAETIAAGIRDLFEQRMTAREAE